jgi:hypothetical protein
VLLPVDTDRFDVTELPLLSVKLDGVNVNDGPIGIVEDERVTVPLKPFKLLSVIVALDEAPGTTVLEPVLSVNE